MIFNVILAEKFYPWIDIWQVEMISMVIAINGLRIHDLRPQKAPGTKYLAHHTYVARHMYACNNL